MVFGFLVLPFEGVGVYLCKSDFERQNGFINKSVSLLSGSEEEYSVMNDLYKDLLKAILLHT
jgi:hypothetical protein